MQRRTLLAGLGALGTAGCVSGLPIGEEADPDGSEHTVNGVHQQTGSILRPHTLPVGGAVPRSEQVLIRTADAATTLLTDDEAITAFVDETGFDDTWLLAVVAGTWQSARPLTFGGLSETDIGWIADLGIETPDGVIPDDAVSHSLLVRVPADTASIAVVIDGEPTGTARALDDPKTAKWITPTSRTSADKPSSCPAADRVTEFRCDQPPDAAVRLDASTDHVRQGDRIGLTLHNDGDRTFNTNTYDWHLEKHLGGTWYHIVPWSVPMPLHTLDPGDTHTWQLRLDAAVPSDSRTGDDRAGDERRIDGIGAGHYAFWTRGWFEDESHEEAFGVGVRFTVGDRPVSLEPTADVRIEGWEDDTLLAETEVEYEDPVTLSLERTSISEDAGTEWIVEQVVRSTALRNGVALSRREQARSVRLRTDYRTVPPLNPDGTITIQFQGTAWQVNLEG